ncbi:MAG TPA: hybrid sensor histidine kinase/response regulator [Bacteroidia bacterium]|nr:hybrid sensor histidine kinase/response regulator [Bacteroidia bacterium]
MEQEKPLVLFLDDEVGNLTGFRAQFRRNFDIEVALTAGEAREKLNARPFHVLLTDQRMPEMSGVEFCESIKDDFPDTVRILVTAYADINTVIDAINKGQVYRYITKPWKDEDILVAVKNAVDLSISKRELRKRTEELQKAYDELNRFIYSASHDMRAPLTSILGVVGLAQQETPDEKMHEYLRMIETSVKRMEVLNNNVIDYYINNKKQARLEVLDFTEMVEETVNSLRYYLGADKINFEIGIRQSVQFKNDGFRVRSVVNNLISNAIKFQRPENPEKRISINAEVDDNRAYLKVSDNGIGIKPESLKHIFDMFYRATIINAGSGIGLYVTKESVDKLGGRIDVQSTEGDGTSFTIELPNLAHMAAQAYAEA